MADDIAALLATVLTLENLFRSDFEDGSLEQLVVSGQPMVKVALAKVGAHWLVTGLPIVLLAPLLVERSAVFPTSARGSAAGAGGFLPPSATSPGGTATKSRRGSDGDVRADSSRYSSIGVCI